MCIMGHVDQKLGEIQPSDHLQTINIHSILIGCDKVYQAIYGALHCSWPLPGLGHLNINHLIFLVLETELLCSVIRR